MRARNLFLVLLILIDVVANTGALTTTGIQVGSLRRTRTFAETSTTVVPGFDRSYKLLLPRPVQDKNFYLLSLFQRRREVRNVLAHNQTLNQLATEKSAAWSKALTCQTPQCFDDLLRLDPATIDAVAQELQTLATVPSFRRLVRKDLRASAVFIKYQQQTDAEMLAAAWKDAAAGLNRILSVYGLGRDPKYKDIDRVSFDVSTEDYRKLLKTKMAENSFARAPLFFEPTLNFALGLLEINRRDEAGRNEPLEQGENKAAVQNLKRIKWRDYPYSFILVLGSGGADLRTRISPIGAQRTEVAAQLFLQHKAPLIMLSGGHVHPMLTPYCEAVEMKRYLVEKYRIPAASILIEPHARHTTTNFRNGARLAFRYGIPVEKALVTSSEDHITYTVGADFRTRCLTELGYFPIEWIKRISPVEAEFSPSVTSLFFDANDPLDP